MPDLADRIRIEPTAAPAARNGWAPPPVDRRTVALAALAAMMIGIVVNAVALQHGRRIDLGPDPNAQAAAPPPRPAVVASPAPEPPHPAPAADPLASVSKSLDPIADFLHTQNSDKRLTLAAQNALRELGFSVKPTGAFDAPTRRALAAFEKAHHLATSTAISAKLVRALKSAEAAN